MKNLAQTDEKRSPLLSSAERMQAIRQAVVPANSLTLWFLGQNGFLLKSPAGTLIAIDPYLTNSCAEKNAHLPFDLGRALPVFLKPEDLDVDFFVVTHSHGDHLDEETVRRLRRQPTFVAPWEALKRIESFGIPSSLLHLVHAKEMVELNEVHLQGTFALPTDASDLNHIGLLFTFPSGIRFYNTGDTAYAEALAPLLPSGVDICAICINGGFNNLNHGDAARLVKSINPRIVIPTHYDMMHCNQGDPEMFHIALQHQRCDAEFHRMGYDLPFTYQRNAS